MSHYNWGVSERFAKELGILQRLKKVQTADDMIEKQIEACEETLGITFDVAVPEASFQGGAPAELFMTEEKRKVAAARKRVFRRLTQHIDKAIILLMDSDLYKVKDEKEASAIGKGSGARLGQKYKSLLKIVEILAKIHQTALERNVGKEHRVQKIQLTPTFELFKSRSRTPGRSLSRSLSASSLGSKSRSKSLPRFEIKEREPGKFVFIIRPKKGGAGARSRSASRSRSPSRSRSRSQKSRSPSRSRSPLRSLSASQKAEIIARHPLATIRQRMGYNF